MEGSPSAVWATRHCARGMKIFLLQQENRAASPRRRNLERGLGCLLCAGVVACLAVQLLTAQWCYSTATLRLPHTAAAAEAAKQRIRSADAICFDVDSTVITTEGIDTLAKHFGVHNEVANLTAAAMNGELEFGEAMAMRLHAIQPTRLGIEECLELERPELTTGIDELVDTLHNLGKDVYLVSGGFTIMIEPIADMLNIPRTNIWANDLVFDTAGAYKGFDRKRPTSRSGGKSEVVNILKQRYGYEAVVMIGDGATDMDARPPASAFIGYGGVQVRQRVKAGADWFVTSWSDISAILN
mmetsp:Transcript_29299/g.67458  ORF Transcript_29299/g.67458 Transcript_29299/m.67458 type:complete len:299 (+) Transcript_29299:69-965(+)